MPYINKKEQELLIWVENMMFDILINRPDLFGSPDDYLEKYLKFYDKYVELWQLNEKLIKDTEQLNIKAKESMRRYRNSPETKDLAKQKAREYMRKYNANKRKTPEEIEKLREYNRLKQRESRARRKEVS